MVLKQRGGSSSGNRLSPQDMDAVNALLTRMRGNAEKDLAGVTDETDRKSMRELSDDVVKALSTSTERELLKNVRKLHPACKEWIYYTVKKSPDLSAHTSNRVFNEVVELCRYKPPPENG
jgi:hypothetical protein